MSVAYDNAVTTSDFAVTSLTTGAFTIGVDVDRAACLGLFVLNSGSDISNITGSCGGVAGVLVPLTHLFFLTYSLQLIGVTNPPSGSQTATASWIGADSASLGVVTATGVDQTTPMLNGATNAVNPGSSLSLPLTASDGDLTVTLSVISDLDGSQTTNYTKRTTDFGCLDTGPGTVDPTHIWSHASTQIMMAGATFAKVAGPAPPMPYVLPQST